MNEHDEIKRRQKSRAIITAVLLVLFVLLIYGITIAKVGIVN